MIRRRAAALTSIAVALSGCTTLLGLDGDYGDQTGGAGGGAVGGSGSGGAPSGGGGSGNFSGGGGTAAVAGKEICDDGDDDDGDGKADCADPDCALAGFTCVPAIPGGWVGPVRWESGAAMVPACAGAWGVDYGVGGTELSASSGGTCPTCGCAPAEGVQCGIDVMIYDQVGCAGNNHPETLKATGSCVNVSDPIKPRSVRAVGPMKVVTGSCAPTTTGSASIPAPTWLTHARACRAAGDAAGCSADSSCAPPAAGGKRCVARTGNQACPAGYADRHVLFQGIDDQRSCTSCACGTPTSACQGAEVRHHDSQITGCIPPGTLFSTTCSALDIHPSYGSYKRGSTAPTLPDAKCSPSTSSVTGTAAPSEPLTVCCLP
jgi:hypothetical protein